MPHPDDERLAEVLKALRRRGRARQHDIAAAAGVSRRTEARIEHGKAATLTLGTIRSVFEPLGARVRVSVWWRGSAADRLLDESHAALVEKTVRILAARRWVTAAEVSFSEYGERGSVDVLAGHPDTRSLLVIEVKASLGSLEETNRRLDVKERLAPGLGMARFGWRPRTVSRLLVLPDDRTVRRIVTRHNATFGSIYPARSREVRAWLRRPDGPLRGIWFLSGADLAGEG
ncbi:MAG: hypothetical protein M3395_02440 [Chloroflexota bacterium]|nr:hypothetical protein [Chloroflexota bacterium]